MPLTKFLINMVAVILTLYCLLGLLLFVFQRSLLYFPTPELLHPFAEEVIENDGETIRVIVINPGQRDALIYFGGNAEAVAASGSDLNSSLPNYSIYLVNYRSYGGSTGKPDEQSLYSDALQIFDTISDRHRRVDVLGRSLGSGVASYLASRREIAKLILVTPFDSIREVAQGLYPIVPAGLMLLDEYDSLSRVEQISAPTMILIAEQDNVIPRRHSDNLVSAFPPSQVSAHVIKGTGHNTVSAVSDYYAHIHGFLSD